MRRYSPIVLLSAFALVVGLGFPRNAVIAQTISGTVTDDQHSALSGVLVMIPAIQRHVTTGSDGKFEFTNVSAGVYVVEFSIVGYGEAARSVDCGNGSVQLDVELKVSPLELPAVTITSAPQPMALNNSPQPVSVLEGLELQRRRGQSLMNSAEFLPGVSTFSRGPASMKPVIRGLTSQRVVVAEDGVRHESQQWDDEQSPEIDIFDVDHIEIQRGANSVLYGSDALGGVVNIIKTDASSFNEQPVTLGGSVFLHGYTNNSQAAGALALFGGMEAFEYKGQFSFRNAGDIMTPDGSLNNSGVKEFNASGMVGTKGEWGSLRGEYSHFGQEFHIHPEGEEPPSPTQKIDHDKANLYYNGIFPTFRLEVKGTYQVSERAEYDDETLLEQGWIDSAAIRLRLSTASLDIRAHHAPIGQLYGTIGVSGMSQKNETLGLMPLIPGFMQSNFAAFIYEEYRMPEVSISGGLRVDSRDLDVDANDDLGVTKQSRQYSAVTGTLGAVWHPQTPLTFSLNLGRGWRSPIAEELFINGPDEGSIRYKVGNPDLTPEESFNINLSGKYSTSVVSAEISIFRNRINDYIYLAPTGITDSPTGFEKYAQRQADATLTGMEIDLHEAVTDNIVLLGGFDMVIGKNEETNDWLPLIPAHRFQAGIQYLRPTLLFLNNAHVSLTARVYVNQDRIAPDEIATGGYTLYDIGIGGQIPLAGQNIVADLVVYNLFNKAYYDHLSRYKDYALNPGTDVAVKVSVPFTLVQ